MKKLKFKTLMILTTIGVFLRVSGYFGKVSFWADEAWVAMTLTFRLMSDILSNTHLSPDYSMPPFGFLLAIKVLIEIFGYNEYIFRLFPLFCGLVSLGLYVKLLKDHFESHIYLIAVTLFVFSGPLIFYSSQLKQYSSDVMITVLLFSMSFSLLQKSIKAVHMALFAFVGLLSICISHSAIFILTGIGIAQTLILMRNANKTALIKYLIVYSLWAVAFINIYFNYYDLIFVHKAFDYYTNSFLSLRNPQELIGKILNVFQNPLNMSFYPFGILIFILGVISLFKANKVFTLQLLMPVVITMTASFLHKYPFQGRFLLFLLPILFIFLASGFQFVFKKGFWGKILSVILFLIIFIQPIWGVLKNSVEPQYISEMKPIIQALKENQRRGDLMYLNNEAQYAYKYYTVQSKFFYALNIIGIIGDTLRSDDMGEYVFLYHNKYNFYNRVYSSQRLIPGNVNTELHSLRELEGTSRVWTLFSEMNNKAEQHFLKFLDEKGERIGSMKLRGVNLYLYNFYIK